MVYSVAVKLDIDALEDSARLGVVVLPDEGLYCQLMYCQMKG